MERLTTRSLRRVYREMLCAALHRPPFLCATSMGLSSALFKKWVVDLVLKEGEGGKSKRKGGKINSQGREFQCRANICPGSRWLHVRRPYLPRCLLVGAGSVSRGRQWGGGGSDYVLLFNRNWNETKHFQLSPDPPGSCRLGTPRPPPTPSHSSKRGFDFFFFAIALHHFQNLSLRKNCVLLNHLIHSRWLPENDKKVL